MTMTMAQQHTRACPLDQRTECDECGKHLGIYDGEEVNGLLLCYDCLAECADYMDLA